MGLLALNYKKVPSLETFLISAIYITSPYKNKSFLEREYLEKEASPEQIALESGSVRKTIMKYLRQYEIPLRPEDNRLQGPLPYGKKWRKNKPVDHKGELEVLAKIQDMRGKGKSYQKVADALNAEGVPTRTKVGKWHSHSVYKIVRRIKKEEEKNFACNYANGVVEEDEK